MDEEFHLFKHTAFGENLITTTILYKKGFIIMNIFSKNSFDSANVILSCNNKIGLLLNRGVAMISSIYHCWEQGITYVPLDVDWPNERISSIILDNELDLIITTEEYSNKVIYADTIVVDNNSVVNFVNNDLINDIAYILYTSGTSGKPKGVEIKRSSVENFIEGISEVIDFSFGKRIACFTDITFDIFFLESIMALSKGLIVFLADEYEQNNPRLMAKLIRDNLVDMIQFTPSRMQLLLNYDQNLSSLKSVSEIMIGGEIFPVSLLQKLKLNTTAKIYNMYGPTETTIWSTVSDLTNKDYVDIGYPIKNTEIFILDKNLNILQSEEIGEIGISGKGLARGYVRDNGLTDKKFIKLQQSNTKVYLTGDLGKFTSHGALVYIGRIDNQIKLRGYRVEPEEIEYNINMYKGVNQSVVLPIKSDKGDYLHALYSSDCDIEDNALFNFLSRKLPRYMVPTSYKRVENFTLTENGKLDRKSLLNTINTNYSYYRVKQINFDSKKKEIIDEIINFLPINLGNHNNSFMYTDLSSLGLDSISFINIIVMIEDKYNITFEDDKLLFNSYSSLDSLAEYIVKKLNERKNS